MEQKGPARRRRRAGRTITDWLVVVGLLDGVSRDLALRSTRRRGVCSHAPVAPLG
jgi:hypothetical protein